MTDYLNLTERKALNWYRVNGPSVANAPGSPQRRLRVALVRRGFIRIHPAMRMGEPIRYQITEQGLEYLRR